MFKYILRRLLIMIPVLLGLTMVVFLLVNVLPGDTARIIAGDYADEATVESIREAYGLDKPLHSQYLNFMGNLLRGDFGRSYHSRRMIAKELANVFPKTIKLAIATEIAGVLMGGSCALAAASRSRIDRSRCSKNRAFVSAMNRLHSGSGTSSSLSMVFSTMAFVSGSFVARRTARNSIRVASLPPGMAYW